MPKRKASVSAAHRVNGGAAVLRDIYERLYAAYGPQRWWPSDGPFETAVGAVLTQNTNWQNVEKAIAALKSAGALDARSINGMPHERLAALIKPSGYFNVKARRLKALTAWLLQTCPGGIEDLCDAVGRTLIDAEGRTLIDAEGRTLIDTKTLRDELLTINGIGPETADSILLYALQRPVFVIDAYTRRVLSRHGIMEFDRPYDEFQRLFHECLSPDTATGGEGRTPTDAGGRTPIDAGGRTPIDAEGRTLLYNEYHALLVRVGKLHCRKTPRCAADLRQTAAACPLVFHPENGGPKTG
jgi:endonuclease-3 related protein